MEIKLIAETDNLRFEWSGGEYIDVSNKNHTEPHDIINVWDYKNDKPTIERSFEGFRAKIEEWLDEQDKPVCPSCNERVDRVVDDQCDDCADHAQMMRDQNWDYWHA